MSQLPTQRCVGPCRAAYLLDIKTAVAVGEGPGEARPPGASASLHIGRARAEGIREFEAHRIDFEDLGLGREHVEPGNVVTEERPAEGMNPKVPPLPAGVPEPVSKSKS